MKSNKGITKKVGIIGIIVNAILLIIKFIGGLAFKSQALIADAVNSFGDVFSSSATYIGGKVAERSEDEDHEFGHGKAEYVASFLIGIFMVIVGMDTIYNSITAIIDKKQFEFSHILVIIPIITIVIKGILYAYTANVGKKQNSLLVLSNAKDHRNDVFVSTGVLIGVISGYFGYYFVDGVIGVLISLVIILTGIKIAEQAYNVLIDKRIDEKTLKELRNKIENIEDIRHIDSIKSTPTGDKHIIFVKISVDPNMTVSESHKIAGKIRSMLSEHENVYDTIVHVNPDE